MAIPQAGAPTFRYAPFVQLAQQFTNQQNQQNQAFQSTAQDVLEANRQKQLQYQYNTDQFMKGFSSALIQNNGSFKQLEMNNPALFQQGMSILAGGDAKKAAALAEGFRNAPPLPAENVNMMLQQFVNGNISKQAGNGQQPSGGGIPPGSAVSSEFNPGSSFTQQPTSMQQPQAGQQPEDPTPDFSKALWSAPSFGKMSGDSAGGYFNKQFAKQFQGYQSPLQADTQQSYDAEHGSGAWDKLNEMLVHNGFPGGIEQMMSARYNWINLAQGYGQPPGVNGQQAISPLSVVGQVQPQAGSGVTPQAGANVANMATVAPATPQPGSGVLMPNQAIVTQFTGGMNPAQAAVAQTAFAKLSSDQPITDPKESAAVTQVVDNAGKYVFTGSQAVRDQLKMNGFDADRLANIANIRQGGPGASEDPMVQALFTPDEWKNWGMQIDNKIKVLMAQSNAQYKEAVLGDRQNRTAAYLELSNQKINNAVNQLDPQTRQMVLNAQKDLQSKYADFQKTYLTAHKGANAEEVTRGFMEQFGSKVGPNGQVLASPKDGSIYYDLNVLTNLMKGMGADVPTKTMTFYYGLFGTGLGAGRGMGPSDTYQMPDISQILAATQGATGGQAAAGAPAAASIPQAAPPQAAPAAPAPGGASNWLSQNGWGQ